MVTDLPILPAQPDAALLCLLSSAGLPTDDLNPAAPARDPDARYFFSLRLPESGRPDNPGLLAGCVGCELYGASALLRSLAVREELRGSGIGMQLSATIEKFASARAVTDLYLLTETAERFFQHLGYQTISRDQVPADIAATTQFADICPASAVVMRKALPPVLFSTGKKNAGQ